MAVFEVTGSDGKTYRVEGASAEGAARAVQAMISQASTPDPKNADGTYGTPPDGMIENPYTGQMTDRDMIGANLGDRSRTDAFATGGTVGATLNSADEIVGAVGGDFMREKARAIIEADKENYPGTFLTGQIIGAVGAPGGAVANAVKGARGAIGFGAAAGGADAFNSGEGGLDSRLSGVPLGATIGAAGGAVSVPFSKAIGWVGDTYGPKIARLVSDRRYANEAGLTQSGRSAIQTLGLDPDEFSQRFKEQFQSSLDQALEPQQAARAANLAQFDIPAYKGNVTGLAADVAPLHTAARGAAGGAAEKKARTALTVQDEARKAAAEKMAVSLGKGVPADKYDAASGVSQRLSDIAASEKKAASAMYDAAEAAGVRVDPDVAANVASRIQTRLADEEVDLSLDSFAKARGFMSRLQSRGQGEEGVSLKLVEGARKDLNRAISRADSEDQRALMIIKDEYDTWLDDVVESKMFDGDGEGFEDLKQARRLFAEYAQKFRGKDKGSRFIQDMIDADASPDDVVKWLFSAGRLGTGKMNSQVAVSMKNVLGADSSQWAMVRQAAFRQLTQKPEGLDTWGPKKVSNNIIEFMGNHKALADEFFTKAERDQMLQYAQALRQIAPPEGAVNHSGTAYELSRAGQRAFEALGSAIGFSQGGVAGAVAGREAAKSSAGAKGWLEVSRAMKVKGSKPRRTTPLAVGAGATLSPQNQQR